MDLSVDNLRHIVVMMITLILSITVHEFGHAFVADRLGDRLPRMEERVTLNPMAHADPIGTLLVPAAALLFGGVLFGWGRPVRINPSGFNRKLSMGTAHLLVALAGPMMNLLFGIVISLVLWGLLKGDLVGFDVANALVGAVQLNFVLMFFNLLPVPPLDGSTILREALPYRHKATMDRIAKYGIFILIAFFLIPGLGNVVLWPASQLTRVWLGLLGVL